MTRKEKILGYMNEKEYVPLLPDELASVLDVNKDRRGEFDRLLAELEAEGSIFRTKRGRLISAASGGMKTGLFLATRGETGFVRVEGEDEDYIVYAENTRGALHGDTVLIRAGHRKHRRSAEVMRILEHKNQTVVGRFETGADGDYVIPDNPKISEDILIPRGAAGAALHGQKVVCMVTRWGDGHHPSEGRITEVLGFEGEMGVDILSVLRGYGFETEFPEAARAEAKRVPQAVDPAELAGRRDLRDKNIFTIDGADAKDLDDAVSVEKKENGNYLLGVHIADVSHYVAPKSAIDREAYKRGTSVYLADRVVPMLPVELSNGLCSLHGGVDRLTLSCEMEITPSGQVADYEIFPSVICSKARMTYDAVTAILEEEPPALLEKYRDLVPDFLLAGELADILKAARRARGSIDFAVPEAKVVLDENNKVTDILVRKETVSHHIIEVFMLLANQTVAEHLYWSHTPAVYRVHGEPSRQKMT